MIRLPKLDPELAYIGTSMFLPKAHVEEGPVRAALSFGFTNEGEARVLVRNHPHHLEVPRAFLTDSQLQDLGLRVVDLRPTTFESIDLRPKPAFSLRTRQVAAWTELKKEGDGVLVMACGSGKTICAWYKASQMKVPTLVISHQKAHLENWEKELRTWFDFTGEVGWIRGPKMEYDRPIVFATIQTLAGKVEKGGLPPDFSRRFGLVIFDEVHHLSAKYFSKAADLIAGTRLGLTATDKRNDRSEGIYFSHLGPVIHRDLEQEMDPIFHIVNTDVVMEDETEIHDVTGQRNISKLRTWLGRNPDRNSVISQVVDLCLSEGRKIYALTHSQEHAELLSSLYPGSGCITGKVKNEERLKILNGHDLLFVTMGVGTEAYNRKDLDTLLLMTPFAARDYTAPAFQQATGRVQRIAPGKTDARVYLFMDQHIEESRGMTYSLIKEAQRQQFEVKGWNQSPRRPRKGW